MFVFLFLASQVSALPAASSAFEVFFTGTTEGSGTVDVIMSRRHAVRDRSHGRIDEHGALLLNQTVEEHGKPARRRAWRLVRADGNRITGTISDVRGAVAGEVSGNTLRLRYRMREGPSVEQWITLQPGGRTARNRMTYRRFGLKVATVESDIRRVE